MRTDRVFLVFTSGGLLGAALAGAVLAARRRHRHAFAPCDWRLREADVLLDLARLV